MILIEAPLFTCLAVSRGHGTNHFSKRRRSPNEILHPPPHVLYSGVDLHARSMYICILDQQGRVRLHRNLPAEPGDFLDAIKKRLELYVLHNVREHDPQAVYRLRSVPGIGQILSLVILYEIGDIDRFPRVQDFVSYARLIKCAKESAGKRDGTSGAKIGNAHLKWAFSEAAVLFLRNNPEGRRYRQRLQKKHGKAKSLSILAHKLGRAVYFMLKGDQAFDLQRFVAA